MSEHVGAMSEEATIPRTARCIYSGNEKMYELRQKYWNEQKQDALNYKYMREACDCLTCSSSRESREKLKMALQRDNCSDELMAMGW